MRGREAVVMELGRRQKESHAEHEALIAAKDATIQQLNAAVERYAADVRAKTAELAARDEQLAARDLPQTDLQARLDAAVGEKTRLGVKADELAR